MVNSKKLVRLKQLVDGERLCKVCGLVFSTLWARCPKCRGTDWEIAKPPQIVEFEVGEEE